MSTMGAVVVDAAGGTDVLRSTRVPTPTRVSAEFLIRIAAAGVNPIDAKTRGGRGAAAGIERYPVILGQDFSGTVVESPYEAHPIKPGDEVYGMTMAPRMQGTYAELVAVPALFVARKPKALSRIEAAGVPLAALTAWGAVVDVAKAHEGQRVLITAGAGGVGHFAVQFASFFGARVVATGSQRNMSWLRELGAHEVVDYTAGDWAAAVDPVDIVIDLLGNAKDDSGSRSLTRLKPGGLLVNVPTGSFPTMQDEAAALGVRATGYRVSPDATTLAVITRLIDSGDVRVHIDRVFDLSEAPAAHEALEAGHTRGKIVLRVSG